MTVEEARNRTNLPDRGDETDSELAIPTNNITLGAPTEAEPPPEPVRLRAVASRVADLKEVMDRQQRAVLSHVGAGGTFDIERWNREMAVHIAALSQEHTA